MNAERLRQIEELFHSARERQPADRAALLAQADPGLRREVESLLAQDASGGKILDRPAEDLLTDSTPTLVAPGSQLGPYQIEALLGAGGMGEVYRAVDTRLGRKVAIKISAEQFSGRFEREARAISALNHPHICTLHDVGPNYLVMELVEGETMAAKLKKGKLSIDDTLLYGGQIAAALAEAHSKGITHRDLKPSNIMIAKNGVKVLDFGLAKSAQDETLTASRMAIGTPAYMAPEQREGKETDARTDIYACGLVLHEMCTGRRAPLDQPASIESLPEKLAHTIDRCLAQEPNDRWQSARDMQAELVWAARPEPSPGPPPMSRRTALIGLSSSVTGAAIAWGLVSLRKAEPDAPVFRFSIAPPAGAEFLRTPNHGGLAISPDGRKLAFMAVRDGRAHLWVQALDSLSAQELPGSDDASHPFWSADSRLLGFFAGGSLNRINADGTGLQALWDAEVGQRGSWNASGIILFRPRGARGAIYRIDAVGGKPVPVTTVDVARGEAYHDTPQFLSDGPHFLYRISGTLAFLGPNQEGPGTYIGSLDDSKMKVRILPANSWVQAARGGSQQYLLWLSNDTLVAQKWDSRAFRLQGDPAPLAGPVGTLAGDPYFAVADNGPLVYGGPLNLQLQWLNRKGDPLATVGETGVLTGPRQSPDGRKIAVVRNNVLEVIDLERKVTSRLATNVANRSVMWSPDGTKIAFAAGTGNATPLVMIKNANGAGPEITLAPTAKNQSVADWTSDGRALLYFQLSSQNRSNLWIAPVGEKGKERPVLGTEYEESSAAISPDGRWLAYVTDESGRFEVYVQKLELRSAAAPLQQRTQVSGGGGNYPRWRGDSKELFYQGRNGLLMAVSVKPAALSQDTLEFETPRALFSLPVSYVAAYPYDVSRDGQRFLVVAQFRGQPREPLTAIMNWPAILRS